MRPAAQQLLLLLLLGSLSTSFLPLASCRGHPHHAHRSGLRPAPVTTAGPVPGPVRKICNGTQHPDMCVASVRPYLHQHPVVDAKAMIEMSIQATKARGQAAIASMSAQAASPNVDPDLAFALGECVKSYTDSIENLDSGRQKAVTPNRESVGNGLVDLSAAVAFFSECHDLFVDMNLPDPQATETGILIDMTDNCLAIVRNAYSFRIYP